MTASKTGTSEAMRDDWDGRARTDPFFYVATWRKDWTVESFLASGEEEYQKLVQPVLDELQFAPDRASMLEVGCGAGRMTGSFASRFATVYALDISQEMLHVAKQNLERFPNIHWVLNDGTDLSVVPSNSVQFVFSYFVLQHLPTEDLALTYIREMLRVLKGGGIFLFQFNGGSKVSTMNWKGTLAWGVVDRLWALHLQRLSQATARLLGFDPAMAGKNWRGAPLEATKVAGTVRTAGGASLQVTGKHTPMAWCRGRKSDRAA
jgi:SAM-dependent methyltransferase